MNLARISELTNLINSWKRKLKKLNSRIANLEREMGNAKRMQQKLEFAAESAQKRTAELSAFGLRQDFLEEIIHPFYKMPDCSGVQTAVNREISGAEDEAQKTRNNIWWADREKKQLETEDVV